MRVKKALSWVLFFILCFSAVPQAAQAGLLSGLAKLGKLSKKATPDFPSGFRFADDLKHFPDRDVAEISYSPSHDKWLAKTPDGQPVSLHAFSEQAAANSKPAVLLISELNLPRSLSAFDSLPSNVDINIKSTHGKIFSLVTHTHSPTVQYGNVTISVSDRAQLLTALAHLQRPLSASKVHMVQLAKQADQKFESSSTSTTMHMASVGANELLQSIKKRRGETFILSAKINEGVIQAGKQKVLLADLKQVAAERDVTLVVLNSEKPTQTLQSLAKSWNGLRNQHDATPISTGDFYDLFISKTANATLPIQIDQTGKLRTALSFDDSRQLSKGQSSGFDGFSFSGLRHVSLFMPSQERHEELSDRIHPLIPSSVHLFLIVSAVFGWFLIGTSWFLYQKIWHKLQRDDVRYWIVYALIRMLHLIVFIAIYLPVFGFLSPVYLLAKWSYWLIHLLLIKPFNWLLKAIA